MNIVVTSEGVVSAIGNNAAETVEALRSRRSGIGVLRYLRSAHKELPVGEVKMSNGEMKAALNIPQEEEVSRTALMGIMAIRQFADELPPVDKAAGDAPRVVLVSGTTVGTMDVTENHFAHILEETDHSYLRYHGCGGTTRRIAEYFGVFSDFTTISTACSSAANAIVLGANLIKAGKADIVVAGGSESLSRFHLNGFNSLMILDKERCRPFDETRCGLNLGEGAAYVVLESEEYARKRGADIHAYLSGYGNACDAYHQTASSENGEGAFLAMREALSMAGLQPGDIQYVNAHGTGTPNNDLSEGVALKRIFGETMPLVSSTKSFTGHTTSASGSIEAVICILAMRNGFVPANLGWKNQMPDGITPTLGEDKAELRNVVCNAFGFGGNDTSLIFSSDRTSTAGETFNSGMKIKVLSRVGISTEEELQEIRKYIKPLAARRMGRLMKSSLLSSLKALEQAGVEMPDAVVTGTAYGSLEVSERLLGQLDGGEEESVSPTYFMQSTHNTIGSNIAIKLGCHGYNATYSQGAKSLEWAIADAELLIRSGKCKTVLVGCHDEATPTLRGMLRSLGVEYFDTPLRSVAMVLSCGE